MVDQVSLDRTDFIDHRSPIPYYFQLANYIEEKIHSKAWTPGQLFPSEEEFCERLGVSRTVVRQAMTNLELKGLIVKRNGKRTSVAFPTYDGGLMQNLRGFYEDAIRAGQKPLTKILDFSLVTASAEIADALQLKKGEKVLHLYRLRFLDSEPEVLVRTYLPAGLAPSLMKEDLSNKSLYALLAQKFSLRIARGHRTIEAVCADKSDAKLLEIRAGSPLLQLKSIGLLETGTPLEYFVAKHRGDRSRFHVQLIREHDQISSPDENTVPGKE